MKALDRDDIHISVFDKDGHRHIYIWTEENRSELLRRFDMHASNPDCNLSWYDAAVLSQRVRATEAICLSR